MRFSALRVVIIAVACLGSAVALYGQQKASATPPPYGGVHIHIDGIHVTPVPNAPFVARTEIVSRQKLPDGTERILTGWLGIARSSSGRTHSERRKLVTAGHKGQPRLVEVHLYDPNSRLNIHYDPATHVAREETLRRPAILAPMDREPGQQPVPSGTRVTDLGEQSFNGMQLKGVLRERVIPAARSGTGQPVTITDDYWYSPDLSMYMTIRHDDPRTGEQLIAVTHLERIEPLAEMMNVPADYKVVDETAPEIVRAPHEVNAAAHPAPSNQ